MAATDQCCRSLGLTNWKATTVLLPEIALGLLLTLLFGCSLDTYYRDQYVQLRSTRCPVH